MHGSDVLCSHLHKHIPASYLTKQELRGREGAGGVQLRFKVGERFERELKKGKNMRMRAGKSQTTQLCLDRINVFFGGGGIF